jgi:class 3 adenylate cyclase/tetratricopeptide (TPR) repeat protein
VTFEEVVDQALAMLQRRGRVTYRLLKRQFDLDDEALEDLKLELIKGQRLAVDEEGEVLAWTGAGGTIPESAPPPPPPQSHATQDIQHTPATLRSSNPLPAEAERRQLTVLFCDLVDSTALSSQLDPEDLRQIVRAYQETCAKVIARFEGYIAQYLGDGLLVYFGYPLAHEDDAQRAVRGGLGMVEALGQLNARLERERGVHLAVRLGIHTGLVVVGEVGGGTRQEQLALGETPNIAARLQSLAIPNSLVISAATFQLLGGFFACQPLGTPLLKGLAQPLTVYRVLYESMARSRLEAVGSAGLTPLVGREQELGLLLERWTQVKDGTGQVVLLSGEAGIGKSRLVQVLKEQVATEPQAWLTPCQCSPYYQNTALYPLIDLLERIALRFEREESPEQKLRKLEGFLVQYGLPLAEVVPLFAALLSLPLPADYDPLKLSPEQQKQQTLQILLTILLRIAAQQPVLFIMEDLHWVDPSTLELLSLLVDQGPTARILALFTFRPDFSPPWTGRTHLTQVTVHRLPRRQAVEVLRQVAHGKILPPEVVEQIVAKTDGVPLFVEELTKMVLESGLLQEREDHYELIGPLPLLAIPATLHDSLMARLDRLATVKALAQLGATLGREFSYELLQAVSPWDEETLRHGLQQLVEAEFLYQRGLPPQATYLFKHALIQDAAYQSLLKSTRQQYHQRIAQVLVEQFPALVETQPELLAHHYTEAGLGAPAVECWQRAGERARCYAGEREAIAHYSKGLAVLQTLPVTPARTQHALDLLVNLIETLGNVEGHESPKCGQLMAQARVLCQHTGDTPSLFWVLFYLRGGYTARGEHQTAREVAEQALALAQRLQDRALFVTAHYSLGIALKDLGDLTSARSHFEQALAYDDGQQRNLRSWAHTVLSLSNVARILWLLGYPDQALQRNQEAFVVVQQWSNPYHVYLNLVFASEFHLFRRELLAVHERTEAALALAAEQGTIRFVAWLRYWQGWVLAAQGDYDEGMAQMRHGLDAMQATGEMQRRPWLLALLAEAYGQRGQAEEGLCLLTEALAVMATTGERGQEAELYRIKGELLVQQAAPDAFQAEACFQQALAVARRQQAKAWELRTAMSLSRLWQQQGKRDAARALLAPIYSWFTEGFDTTDLQEARALLEEVGG